MYLNFILCISSLFKRRIGLEICRLGLDLWNLTNLTLSLTLTKTIAIDTLTWMEKPHEASTLHKKPQAIKKYWEWEKQSSPVAYVS